jgi:predicted outer membrane repeat protein
MLKVRNYAKDISGALYVLSRSAVEVYGDVNFVENSADEGGAIAMDGSDSMSQGTLNIRGGVSFRDNTALAKVCSWLGRRSLPEKPSVGKTDSRRFRIFAYGLE